MNIILNIFTVHEITYADIPIMSGHSGGIMSRMRMEAAAKGKFIKMFWFHERFVLISLTSIGWWDQSFGAWHFSAHARKTCVHKTKKLNYWGSSEDAACTTHMRDTRFSPIKNWRRGGMQLGFEFQPFLPHFSCKALKMYVCKPTF